MKITQYRPLASVKRPLCFDEFLWNKLMGEAVISGGGSP